MEENPHPKDKDYFISKRISLFEEIQEEQFQKLQSLPHDPINFYAEQVRDQIHEAGYYVDVDTSDNDIQKKVRDAQVAQYNYILVVDPEEATTGQVNVRLRDEDGSDRSKFKQKKATFL